MRCRLSASMMPKPRPRPGHRNRRHRHVRRIPAVEVDHLAHVHAVDVIGAEDGDHVRRVALDEVDVLEDGVGGALEPLRTAAAHLRRHDGDELAGVGIGISPGLGDVLDQRLRLVLNHHVDAADLRVHQVTEHEVGDPVAAAERHRRLGAFCSQRMQPGTLAAGQDHREYFHGVLSLTGKNQLGS
jgi:hypothetical protein